MTPTTMAEAVAQIDALKTAVAQLARDLATANDHIETLRAERDTWRSASGR